jgi:hypothetical protein
LLPWSVGSNRAEFFIVDLIEIEPNKDGPEWERLALDVASSVLDRAGTTERLRKTSPRREMTPGELGAALDCCWKASIKYLTDGQSS